MGLWGRIFCSVLTAALLGHVIDQIAGSRRLGKFTYGFLCICIHFFSYDCFTFAVLEVKPGWNPCATSPAPLQALFWYRNDLSLFCLVPGSWGNQELNTNRTARGSEQVFWFFCSLRGQWMLNFQTRILDTFGSRVLGQDWWWQFGNRRDRQIHPESEPSFNQNNWRAWTLQEWRLCRWVTERY